MKTTRHNTFETNSSSCHVLTVAGQDEYELVKNGQAVIYVPHYSSDSDQVYGSEILTKDKYLSLVEKSLGDKYETYLPCIESLWENTILGNKCYEDVLDDFNIGYSEMPYNIEDIVHHCSHEESAISILDGAIKKEANGAAVYVACWEKLC